MSAAPDLVAPVVAFRAWKIIGERLVSPNIPVRWEGRTLHAACHPVQKRIMLGHRGWLDADHASPDPRCQCGIYGYFTPGPRSWYGEAFWCEGVVTAWGRIEVHRDGFRAQHARVEALAAPDETRALGADAVRAAADALGVPLVDHPALEAFAAGLGGTGVPPSLLPG